MLRWHAFIDLIREPDSRFSGGKARDKDLIKLYLEVCLSTDKEGLLALKGQDC